ncbi:molybdopterin cofactor-binding domain-containing protein [Tabrizicola sp.]|uniref:xanthine dehydrogenase family protein molybdopterin-binding subunit n=1 Tax=Tabrizicola sp. TaxID=2005166 RepID=UPI00286CE41D|nr:molybdopterin cofactor-binding domain-containing protein [Tabrizicola sp.]
MSRLGTIARRTFLIGSAAIAGGVAFGWYRYRRPYPNPIAGAGIAALTPYVLIEATGVTIIAPRAEMGQGIHTTLAALVAEELDMAWEDVTVIHGPASHAYYNAAALEDGVPFAPTDHGWLAETARGAMDVPAKFLGIQLTGGSTSVPDAFEKMRAAGAMARVALVAAAARRLGLDPAVLKTEAGAVVTPDGTRLAYTDLAVEAASVDLPDVPPLRDRKDWKLLGKTLPRKDVPGKSTGTATFTGDIRLPGMKFATVRMNPGLGGAMTGYDSAAAEAMPGVERVISLGDGVAVIASNTWLAIQAADVIAFDWAPAPYPANTAEMAAQMAASFSDEAQDARPRNDGDVEAALAAGTPWEAEYSVPHLAHATMEPMSAIAWLHDGMVEVWTGTQTPTLARSAAAETAGVETDKVEIHTQLMGGGFGRRAEVDTVRQAVAIAKAMEGTPVLLSWTREEDMTHDMYRPMAMGRVRATVTEGAITAFDFATAATSTIESMAGRLGFPALGPDATILQAAWEQPYAFPNYRVTGYRAPKTVPVGFWRSVGASQNAFFHDSAMDELAHLAGVDPLLFRMRQMNHTPSIKVMEAVAEMSNWGITPPGRARGLAFAIAFGVPTAEVIEVENTDSGIRLTGAWIAADVGIALDPGNIEAQLSGAMIYGLSAAMNGEITFTDGRVDQQNFWDYEPMRLRQCPPIAVRILESGGPIRGVGEPGTPPAAPALANAIFALTGTRHRSLPLKSAVTFA